MKRILVAVVVVAACDRSAPTPPPTPSTSATPAASPPVAQPAVDAQAPAPVFEAVIGDWREGEAGGAKGFAVDGTKWRDGTPSANLADQAKKLYGDRYAEFLDGVKAFAFFPLAVARDEPPSGDVELSVRFYPIAGKIDQAAGIAFDIATDGSYAGVRANALEDNLLFFRVAKGKRTIVDTIRDVSTPTKTWHTLSLKIVGTRLEAFVDGAKKYERKLDAAPKGRVGLWSKADSHVLFADFAVKKL
jgi:hypothetical protein